MSLSFQEVSERVKASVTDRLDAHLRAEAEKRHDREFKIGAWNAASCPRSLWLQLNGTRGEPLPPRSLMVFDLGNKVEDSLVDFLISAGVPLVRTNESRDTFDLPPIGRIRMDAWLDIGDGLHLPADVKSMSNDAYERAEKGGWEAMEKDIFASKYVGQLECYLRDPTLGSEWGILFCFRKETSHWFPMIVPRSDERWEALCRNVALARGAAPPARPHALRVSCFGADEGKCINGKTPARGQDHSACKGTGKAPNAPLLPIVCCYCPVKEACWGPLEMGTWDSGKPWWRPLHVPDDARTT